MSSGKPPDLAALPSLFDAMIAPILAAERDVRAVVVISRNDTR